MPSYRVERIERFGQAADKARSIVAGLLLLEGYRRFVGSPSATLPDIILADKEKPYFAVDTGIHFNISHSGQYVVCVYANAPVGIDVQEHKNLKEHFIKRIFSLEEQDYVRMLPADQQGKAYMDLYALKEAYVKYTGEGMSRSFGELSMKTLLLSGEDQIDGSRICGKHFERELPGYSLAITTTEEIKHIAGEYITQFSEG